MTLRTGFMNIIPILDRQQWIILYNFNFKQIFGYLSVKFSSYNLNKEFEFEYKINSKQYDLFYIIFFVRLRR